MIYYIKYNKDNSEHTAGPKAPTDIYDISRILGYNKLVVSIDENRHNKILMKFKIIKFWFSLMTKLKERDVVIYQHPTYGVKEAIKAIPVLKKYKKVKFISVIHDLESLRRGINSDQISNDILDIVDSELLPLFDVVICHNNRMKDYLIGKGIAREKIIVLEIFDYLSNELFIEEVDTGIAIAGNLHQGKSEYLYDLLKYNINVKFNLFGPNFNSELVQTNNIEYFGSFDPSILPGKLKGKYGLVWDGNSIETCSGNTGNYLRYNNPHKTSLYLSSGIPIIVWKEAAMAEFVEKYKVGILVDNLLNLNDVLNSVSEEEYNEMRSNARKIGEKLRDGHFYRRAIKESIRLLEELE